MTFCWKTACTAATSLRTIGGGGGTISFMVCIAQETRPAESNGLASPLGLESVPGCEVHIVDRGRDRKLAWQLAAKDEFGHICFVAQACSRAPGPAIQLPHPW